MAYKIYHLQERTISNGTWARTGESFFFLVEALERRDERRVELRDCGLPPDARVVDDTGFIYEYRGE